MELSVSKNTRNSTFLRFLFIFILISCLHAFDSQVNPLEISDIQNDQITIEWSLPEDLANETTWQRAMIMVLRSSLPNPQPPASTKLPADARSFTFSSLIGNTTYRTSIEAFQDDISLSYASGTVTTSLASLEWLSAPSELTLMDKTESVLDIWWSSPPLPQATQTSIINQYLVNVYELNTQTKMSSKKFSFNIPIPKTSHRIERLTAGTVYNITVQAGTSYGYGKLIWSVFSTLAGPDDPYILKERHSTPNSITLTWPANWLPNPNSVFTMRAKTLHSPDKVEKEMVMTGVHEGGRNSEFVLRNLHPASTYNISILVNEVQRPTAGKPSKFGMNVKTKSAWGVFSTLTQGEYTVSEPRIVVETDSAVSIVFQPLKHLGNVAYQLRYTANDGSRPIETHAFSESELICPKFGCEWNCVLLFNLAKRPRDYNFEVRAKVEDVWNKWTAVARRPWNLLERVCSINPPNAIVDNIGNYEHMREIEMDSSYVPTPMLAENEPWRYLLVIDNRANDYSALDISKLADKATADIDDIPYYVAASLSLQQVRKGGKFRVGDGNVIGGYLNYPLTSNYVDPRWTLVPLSQTEHEIMEPKLKTCGFNEQGSFDCSLTFSQLVDMVPMWGRVLLTVFAIVLLFITVLVAYCLCRSACDRETGTRERSVMYYEQESPRTTRTTHDYRRIERREFKPSDLEERMRFVE